MRVVWVRNILRRCCLSDWSSSTEVTKDHEVPRRIPDETPGSPIGAAEYVRALRAKRGITFLRGAP